jgi:hypothetical protein
VELEEFVMRAAHGLAILLALGAVVICPAGANASWVLTISDGSAGGTLTFTGGSSPPPASEFTLVGPGTSPDSKYGYIIGLTDGQTPTQSSLSEVAISITNLTGGNLPLTTSLTESDFTLPGSAGSQVIVESNISSTSPTGGSGTFVTQFNGIAMPTQAFTIPDTGSGETQVFTRGASYTVEQTTTVTLAGNSNLQFTGTDTVIPVPEPSTFAMTCCGLLCCAPLYRLKRGIVASRI